MAPALAKEKVCTEKDYDNLPENVRAELIEGQLYYMSAPSRMHQEILSALHIRIGTYILSKGGFCKVYPAPFAVKLFDDRDDTVEPDLSVICDSGKLTDRGCSGAPDWIIEIISPGNPSHDYVRKLNLYLDAGVREYWIVDPRNLTVLVYDLEHNHIEDFKVKQYTFQDKIKVNIYEDFEIDFGALNLWTSPNV